VSDGLLAAQRAVLESKLTSMEKLTVIAILNFWSKASPQPFPSAETLARLTSYDERSIRRTIKSLAVKGAVGVLAEPGRPNRYDLAAVFAGTLPRAESHPSPGLPVTPDCESPLSESQGHPCQPVTPPLTVSPGTPDCVPPEVSNEVTQQGTHVKRAKRARAGQRPATWFRVPAGWEPNDEHRRIAAERRVDFQDELERFKDFDFERPKRDADATFRNWLRNSARFVASNGKQKRGAAPVSTTFETSDDFGGLV
jgi:hypothetical protein